MSLAAAAPAASAGRRVADVLFWVAVAAVVAVHLVVVIPGVFQVRLWEDEAFNLTVPLNLLRGLGYTSDGTLSGSALTPFDPRISTGPLVLLPIAAVMALGADPVIGGRLVVLCFYVALLAALALLGRRLGGQGPAGRWAALVAVIVPLGWDTWTTNSPIQTPVDILGEVPAAALLAWALVVLRRRPYLAALLVGLAMQAKLIALLSAPALVVAVLMLESGPFLRRLRVAVVRGLVALVPSALVEVWKLIALGGGYAENLKAYARFILWGGQHIDPVPPADKLAAAFTGWTSPPWLTLLVVAAFAIAAGLWLRRDHRWRLWDGRADADAEARALLVAALIGVAVWTAWWALSRQTPTWDRHPSPGYLVLVPVLAAFLVRCVAEAWRRARASARPGLAARIAAVAASVVLVAALATQLGARAGQAAAVDRNGLAAQRAAAAQLATLDTEWLSSDWGALIPLVVLSGAHSAMSDASDWTTTPRVISYEGGGDADLDALCPDVVLRWGTIAACMAG